MTTDQSSRASRVFERKIRRARAAGIFEQVWLKLWQLLAVVAAFLLVSYAGLWPHLLFGLYIFGTLALLSPTVLIWSLPLTAGYILAIPFAMLTAAPALGAFFVRTGLCGIPEDFDPPAEIIAIQGGDAR